MSLQQDGAQRAEDSDYHTDGSQVDIHLHRQSGSRKMSIPVLPNSRHELMEWMLQFYDSIRASSIRTDECEVCVLSCVEMMDKCTPMAIW